MDWTFQDKVEAELYLYTADMACNYHEEKVDEPKYCSLMIVKRSAVVVVAVVIIIVNYI